MPTTGSMQEPRPRRTFKLTLLLVILFSVISFVTSYKGLVILNVESDGDLGVWQSIFVGFMVFTIQVTLVVTLLFTIHGYSKITRVLAFLVYLVAMLFSVFFSYGWWYEAFRAGSYAQEVYKDSIETVRSDAKTYEQSFLHVGEVADELSKYSTKRAREENLYGGTCDEKSMPGKGALNFLRNDEAEYFDRVSKDLSDLQGNVGTHIHQLNKLLDNPDLSEGAVSQRERELNDIVALIGGYKSGAVAARIRTGLEGRRGDKRKFLESTNPKTEERAVVSCMDEEITSKIDALLLALEDLPDTRKVALFDQNNNRTVLQRSWEVFASVLSLDGLVKVTPSGIKLSSTDYVPLVAGLLIDLFILILGLIDGLEYGRFYTGKRYSAEDARQLADFHSRHDADNDQLGLLRPHLYHGWRNYYLMVPVTQAIQTDQDQQLSRLIAWLDAHKKIDHFAHSVEIKKLPDVMQAFFTAENEYNRWRRIWLFDIYRIKPGMWRELVISHARHQPVLAEQPL